MSTQQDQPVGIWPPDATQATPERWVLYRAWGFAPPSAGLQVHLADFLLGPQLQLLYVGITKRTGPARWAEHQGQGEGQFRVAPKKWAPYVVVWEIDTSCTFATEDEALQAEAEAIHAEQPLGNIAGKGRAERRAGATRTRRYLPVKARLLRAKAAAVLAVLLFAGLGLPRLVTGEFPASWEELAIWTISGAIGALLLRLWTRAHLLGARRRR